MPVPIIAFQLFNLNDYDVKIFSSFEEDHLYFTNLTLVDNLDQSDEGSSKIPERLSFQSPTNNKLIITQFPFTGISAKDVSIVDVAQQHESTAKVHSVTLFDGEYNYLLVLYLKTEQDVANLLSVLSRLQIQTTTASTYQEFISNKIDELDQKIYNESKGTQRLQKKVNPIKKPFQIRNITEHVHFLEGEDPTLEQSYLSVIGFFDNVFLNANNAGSSFDATTFKRNI
ncbi:hypothetical protein WICPIJ_002230 [Wickerhamomyces pijperi]|uniref:Uncharacterized protein n=1 Tax=Wickerhamomyces pijperi TaxID=599730 RepID=A0A9P8TPV3_WICPI|nr:hypothetical protein WICPIJ_002230 [Wickerhamomyces pijperi]